MTDARIPDAALMENGEKTQPGRVRSSEAEPLHTIDEVAEKESMMGSISLASLGPALVCCLADGDAGSLIVAAQSGARWRYSLTLVQIMLVPILFAILEALVRTGVNEKCGFSAMIRAHFGLKSAVFSLALLLISCFGAIVSEMSGIASVAALWGCSEYIACGGTALFVIFIVVLCDYRQVERVALIFGLFELTFIVVLFRVHPAMGDILRGMVSFDFNSNSFMRMLAASIGAVITPWMIYFQQSAVVARRFTTTQEVAQERTQSLLGSCMAQAIVIAVMIVLAGTPQEARNLENIAGIQVAIEPIFGAVLSKVLISLAFCGGSVCAVFVVSLAAAWAVCDTIGDVAEDPFSLDQTLMEAPKFYGSFVMIVLAGSLVLLACPNVIKLNVFIELLNALMIPMSLLFLFLVVTGPCMHSKLRIVGAHRAVILVLFSLTSSVAIVSALASFLPDD